MFDKNFKSSVLGDVKKRLLSFCWYENEKMKNNWKAMNLSSIQLTTTTISTIELKNLNNLIGNGLIDVNRRRSTHL